MTRPLLIPFFDGHNDTLLRVHRATRAGGDFNFLAQNPSGHLDLPRARQGGLVGGIFAVFVPPQPGSPESAPNWGLEIFPGGYRQQLNSAIDPVYALAFTLEVIEDLRRLERDSGGAVRVVTTSAGLDRCLADGALAVILHLEGAEAVKADLSNLRQLFDLGVRSIGPVWSRPNAFAEGVPFCFPQSPDTGPGLTAAGRDLIRECGRMGILVDLAHMNEKGFFEAAALSSAPLVVSHSNAHALLPATRNLTDAQIDAVGQSGGIIGLNFEPMMTGMEGRLAEDVPLSALARHAAYIASRIGVDHVAFGSDFDGTQMPSELGDVSGLPKLAESLRSAGFTAGEVDQMAYQNWIRVLRTTWVDEGDAEINSQKA